MITILLVLSLLTPGHNLAGHATWYGTGPGRGHAAAGPALRQVLGSHWRGMHVRVCNTANRCVRVVLDDYCVCRWSNVIDLSDEDFYSLTHWLGRGRIEVNVWR